MSRPLVRSALGALFTAALASTTLGGAAQAAVVAASLPYGGSPDWSTIVFGGTSMTTDGTKSTLSTANGQGVWFGYWQNSPPAWSLGTSAQGNYLSMSASFSTGATDWSAYLFDQSHFASIAFAPTGCVDNCYGLPGQAGVSLAFADGADAGDAHDQVFVALDLSVAHTFEFLLKNGQVSYRIDGLAHTGAAGASGATQILVIGDGSGTNTTGEGQMYVHAASLETSPVADVLESTVSPAPEPAAWALMIGGFGMAGAVLRRRRGTGAGRLRARGAGQVRRVTVSTA